MNILALDTCFGACSVAAGCLDSAVGLPLGHEFELRQTGHAEALMPMVERVMVRSGFSFVDIDRIAVTTGPGSFTGMRIGIAAARALSLATGAPVIGLPTLKVMAETARRLQALSEPDLPLPPVLMIAVDARKEQVYAQMFGAGFDTHAAAAVLSPADAASLVPAGAVAVAGSGATLLAQHIDRSRTDAIFLFPELQPNAACLLSLAYDAPANESPVRPLYLRPPDAKPQDGKMIPRMS